MNLGRICQTIDPNFLNLGNFPSVSLPYSKRYSVAVLPTQTHIHKYYCMCVRDSIAVVAISGSDNDGDDRYHQK